MRARSASRGTWISASSFDCTNAALVSRHYRWETLNNSMNTADRIKEICDSIAREFRPKKIIVFGSHAYGDPGPFSDLDLLVVMPYEGSPLQQAARIIGRVNPAMGVDLIVRTPKQIQERLEIQDAFIRDIIERGRVAYEAHHA